MRTQEYIAEVIDAEEDGTFAPSSYDPLTKPQPQALAMNGFAQTFGLHPGMALLTFVVDSMLFASDIATAGAVVPLAMVVAGVLGVITFMAQRKWYGDDVESAFIKALILALLTAIPTSLPGFLCVPAGVVGLFRKGDR